MRVDVRGKASHVWLHYRGENAFEAMLATSSVTISGLMAQHTMQSCM